MILLEVQRSGIEGDEIMTSKAEAPTCPNRICLTVPTNAQAILECQISLEVRLLVSYPFRIS